MPGKTTDTKTALISIIGRPNAGKSTLLNALVGEKIAIVSPKPQTTRNRVRGVMTVAETQLVFTDTPGFHKPRTKLGESMVKSVNQAVADGEATVLVVEPEPNIGTQERILIERVAGLGRPAVLAINKIDTVEKAELLAVIALYSKAHDFAAIVPISAKKGDGIADLTSELVKFARTGIHLFPGGETTDMPDSFVVSELLREKLLICLDREIPHGTAIEIEKFSERGSEEDPVIDVEAVIYCEKQSHKGIIVGRGGETIKKIGSLARVDMERYMGARVNLQTWVKVRENWRESASAIRNFGLDE